MIERKFLVALGVAGAVGLAGCGGGGTDASGSDADSTPQSGVFVDAPVAGIKYQTETRSGQTDAQGRFEYLAGEAVTFSLGDIELPPVAGAGTVTPLDIFGAQDVQDRRVVNLARLLQTLDSDGDTTNGLQIDAATHAAAEGATLNFDQPVADFESESDLGALLASAGDAALIPAADAVAHLAEHTSIVGSWYAIPSGAYDAAADYIVVNFMADGTYIMAEGTLPVSGDSGTAGVEAGTYSWNLETGAITATPSVDENGEWGLSHGLDAVTIRRDGDVLTVFESSDADFVFKRAVEHGLQGAWIVEEGGDRAIVTFTADGTYAIAEIGAGDDSGGPGGEFGSYSVDGSAGTFTVTTFGHTDSNGDWGLSGNNGSPIAFSIEGDTLSLDFGGGDIETATRLR